MKKIKLLIPCLLICVCALSQITDSTTLRNYINANIIPNGTRSITATQLNTIENGHINVYGNIFKKFVDSIWVAGDSIKYRKNGLAYSFKYNWIDSLSFATNSYVDSSRGKDVKYADSTTIFITPTMLNSISGDSIKYKSIYAGTNNNYVQRNIFFFGDSKTAQASLPVDRWTTRVCQLTGYKEINKGANGQFLQGGMTTRLSEIPNKVDSVRYLFFSYGTNDIILASDTVTTFTTGTFISNYQTVINSATSKGWSLNDIYILTTTPISGYPLATSTRQAAYLKAFDTIATNNPGINIVNVYNTMSAAGGAPSNRYLPDGLHENAIGCDIVARTVLNQINYTVKRNGQSLAVNGLAELNNISIKQMVKPSSRYNIVVADSSGRLQILPLNTFIENAINKTTAQIADVNINGLVTGSSVFANGFTTPDATKGKGIWMQYYNPTTTGSVEARDMGTTGQPYINLALNGSTITTNNYVRSPGFVATALNNPPAGVSAAVLGYYSGGPWATLYARNGSSANVDLLLGDNGGIMVKSGGGPILINTTTNDGINRLQVNGRITSLGNTIVGKTETGSDSSTNMASTAFVKQSLAAQTIVSSGSYTPTLTNTTNISSSALNNAIYTRNGNVVHVAISVNITPTTGSSNTVLKLSLPVSGATTGSGVMVSASGGPTGVIQVATTTEVNLTFVAATNTVNTYYIQFDYTL